MFTGLVQAVGTIQRVGEDLLKISCVAGHSDQILTELAIGDSVAVDGVCLTVTELLPQGFVAIASPETLSRSTLGQFPNAYVNLESSLRAGSKLGGHFVTGHVDGVGCLVSSVSTASAWEMKFAAPQSLTQAWVRQIAPYIVPKGSIAVNGVSLTVADCDIDGNWFVVAVIPHTYSETNLHSLKPGDWVNVEADILGKYVAKFLRTGWRSASETAWEQVPAIHSLEEITPDFLAEHGY
ncbi:MAG: riboflavin synthase [Actinomycetota bacterium]